MATNVFAATRRERCILLLGMGSCIDFTSAETLVCSFPFRAVSFIVWAVCLQIWFLLYRCRDSDSLRVEETTASIFCLGVCRVPGLGQSALSSVAGSAGPLTTSSCCPLLETILQLVVNHVDYTPIIIRLFNPTPLTLRVRLAETNDWSLCWAQLRCEKVGEVGYSCSYSEIMHLLIR